MNVKVTHSGLLAASHLVGAQSVYNGLKKNKDPKDANGTKASTYMKKFGGYDLYKLIGTHT